MSSKAAIEALAEQIGVTINGPATTDPQICDERVYRYFLARNSLAIGEAFMDKLWDCEDLAGFYTKVMEKRIFLKKTVLNSPKLFFGGLLANLQSQARAFQVAEHHYDLGGDLYTATLDKRMVYTSAIWDGVDTLDAAQEQKLEAICQQLDLKPGQRVLDIGCGWGSFMKYAAEKYGVSCVGLTVSKGQTALGEKLCTGLPVEFVISDYRDYEDAVGFDHVVSIEMIEAVGPKNFRTYFEKAHELLKDGGKFLLQAIVDQTAKPIADPWLDKYIFRNGVLPSAQQLTRATQDLFFMEQVRDIGPDYDKTLMAWWQNFDAAYEGLVKNNPEYDECFYRMWKYYLQGCAALFRTRNAQDWRVTLVKI